MTDPEWESAFILIVIFQQLLKRCAESKLLESIQYPSTVNPLKGEKHE